jgi:putative ABC transport system permease protein
VALAVVIMVGAGLLTGSLLRLYEINPGFTPERLLTTPLHLPQARYRSAAQVRAFFDEALGRISAIPGVVAAGAATQLPFGGFSSGVAFEVPNRIEGAPDEGTARWAAITPGYVATMQIPLVRGRLFDARDTPGSEPVGLINETLARRFFPNQDPLGRRLSTSDVPALTIVGVLRDVKYWKLNDTIDPELYQPEAQVADLRLSVVVRTAADSRAIAAAVREAVWSLEKDEPVPAMVTYEQMIDRRHAEARLATILVGLFATLALALSAMGIYGAVAYSVSRRTREIGIRLALGGTASGVQALVIRQGLFVVAIGVVVGLGAAAALTRVLANLLYDTSPTDPVTFVATATLLMGVAAIAAYVPALRAARVDPMASLRAD